MAEFVLTIPIWIVLVVGTIQICMLMQASFFTRQAVQTAARVFTVRQPLNVDEALEYAMSAATRVARRMRPIPTGITLEMLPP